MNSMCELFTALQTLLNIPNLHLKDLYVLSNVCPTRFAAGLTYFRWRTQSISKYTEPRTSTKA